MSIEQKMILKSKQLVDQIKEAERLKKPIEALVKEHINLLEEFHDVFVKNAEERNFDFVTKTTGEVQIYDIIRTWAKKIGLPIDKYNKKIFELRSSIFGEEATRKNFHDNI